MKSDGLFYANRCLGCRRIVTKLQVLAMMEGTTGDLCPCGARSISPCNITGLDWLLPRVWKLVYAVFSGKLAPEPEASRAVKVEALKPVGGASA